MEYEIFDNGDTLLLQDEGESRYVARLIKCWCCGNRMSLPEWEFVHWRCPRCLEEN